ncbi:MAG: sigma-70 family RNA polymerase sigma factor [Candidatus Eisenbacteria bacterium]|uniref:Sigma-70 family RNA polymerase sigma factor n=1 Tax=Eiseniibacteriota bacterium TaxID=2212470 RepID=A0A956RM84_UNCEI|nr:sigma-70 family RNA polymerase sigma factor [Candidatus Eisenbacteria bacterium]
MSPPDDVTEILQAASAGDRTAFDRLLPLIYEELREIAERKLGFEREGHTLQATALAHEAFLKLVDQTRVEWRNRAHFFAVASQAIRRILVDHARHHAAQKRGGGERPLSYDEILDISVERPDSNLLHLDRALERLAVEHPEKARVVELRFFGGLTSQEAATVLGMGVRTVERHWEFSRAWLYRNLMTDGED